MMNRAKFKGKNCLLPTYRPLQHGGAYFKEHVKEGGGSFFIILSIFRQEIPFSKYSTLLTIFAQF